MKNIFIWFGQEMIFLITTIVDKWVKRNGYPYAQNNILALLFSQKSSQINQNQNNKKLMRI